MHVVALTAMVVGAFADNGICAEGWHSGFCGHSEWPMVLTSLGSIVLFAARLSDVVHAPIAATKNNRRLTEESDAPRS
jgi:hypothetical protein